jgi:hypothetical protein
MIPGFLQYGRRAGGSVLADCRCDSMMTCRACLERCVERNNADRNASPSPSAEDQREVQS